MSEMLQEHDEPILRHLEDIKVKYSDPGKPMSFELEFLFSENEFFSNRSLSKVYQMRAEPDETDPLSFEGPEIIKCNGCKIDWKKGSNRVFQENWILTPLQVVVQSISRSSIQLQIFTS